GGGNGDGPLEQTAGDQGSLGFEMGGRYAAGDRRWGDDRGRTTRLMCTSATSGSCGPDGGATARVGWREPAHTWAAMKQSKCLADHCCYVAFKRRSYSPLTPKRVLDLRMGRGRNGSHSKHSSDPQISPTMPFFKPWR